MARKQPVSSMDRAHLRALIKKRLLRRRFLQKRSTFQKTRIKQRFSTQITKHLLTLHKQTHALSQKTRKKTTKTTSALSSAGSATIQTGFAVYEDVKKIILNPQDHSILFGTLISFLNTKPTLIEEQLPEGPCTPLLPEPTFFKERITSLLASSPKIEPQSQKVSQSLKKILRKKTISVSNRKKQGLIFSSSWTNNWFKDWFANRLPVREKQQKSGRTKKTKKHSNQLNLAKLLQKASLPKWKLFNHLKTRRPKLTTPSRSFFQEVWQQTVSELHEIITPQQTKKSTRRRQKNRGFGLLFDVFSAIRQLPLKIKHAWDNFPFYSFYMVLSIFLSLGILGGSYGLYVYVFKDLPQATDLLTVEQQVTTRITDRNGELLFRIYEDENRTLVPLMVIPKHTVQATIAIEDQNFYSHHGFSIKGIVRAFLANIQGKPVQGGSTITQQLVKNRLLSPERTLQRKIKELILSVLVDGTFTKEQIIEMYLNQVAYGGATYGIEEAAQTYFGKPVSQLSLAESAMLAGLPAAPSAYNPFGSNPELAYARQHEVLRRMVEENFITQEEADAAKSEVLQFRTNTIDIRAPHFVMYVRELLADEYGEELLTRGGLEVTTTLDLELQDTAQEIITTEINSLARLRVGNGAALITNPETGEILSMIGSKDYFDFQNDGQVNVTLRPRQPGSSIKPLTYALAFEQGKNSYSMIDDSPVVYHTPGSRPYAPKNYDGKFHGRVTLRQALASSYNIPAVKLLAEVGINNLIDKAETMGITTWTDRKRFGLSLTLGGGEVLMTDMAELYGTFANEGYTIPLNPILEIKDSEGNVLYRNTCVLDHVACAGRKTLDPRVAYQITDVLSDNRARTPAFGPQSDLVIPNQQVSVKTGTTNNLHDNWTIGYTSDRLVAVWVGNNDNTPMSYIASGVTGASPIWNDLMSLLLDENNPHTFQPPAGLIEVEICAQTGTLTCSGCPTVVKNLFVPGTEPTTACNPAIFRPKPSPSPDPNRDQILEGLSF